MTEKMALNSVLGVSDEGTVERRYNLWVGVSDNPWFKAPGNLEVLVRWALEHTRDHLLIWIPGRLYAINFNHIEKKGRARALREGYATEDEFRLRLRAAGFLPDDPKKRVGIRYAGYDDVMTPDYVRRRAILFRAFSAEGRLYQRLINIADDILRARGRTITKARKEAVALYQLQELPMFLGPVRTLDDDRTPYEVEVYPGMGKFDVLVRDLIEGRVSEELTTTLDLHEPCGVANVNFVKQS